MSKQGQVYVTKPFMSGRSQAIRIPKEYRLDDDTEVVINKVGECLVLTPRNRLVQAFRDGCAMLTDDFMADGRP